MFELHTIFYFNCFNGGARLPGSPCKKIFYQDFFWDLAQRSVAVMLMCDADTSRHVTFVFYPKLHSFLKKSKLTLICRNYEKIYRQKLMYFSFSKLKPSKNTILFENSLLSNIPGK